MFEVQHRRIMEDINTVTEQLAGATVEDIHDLYKESDEEGVDPPEGQYIGAVEEEGLKMMSPEGSVIGSPVSNTTKNTVQITLEQGNQAMTTIQFLHQNQKELQSEVKYKLLSFIFILIIAFVFRLRC